jgi:GxxExxY protein
MTMETGQINHRAHEGHEGGIAPRFDDLSGRVIGCAIKVHKELGPGLLESTYEACLMYELGSAGIAAVRQVPIQVQYKGQIIEVGYRADMVVEQCLLLELKSVETVTNVHDAQILTYMKLGKFATGLLLNFNVKLLKDGIRRYAL